VAPLQRAVAVAEVDRVALAIGEHLDLHVARLLQELLHVDHIGTEGGGGLAAVICTEFSRAASLCTTRMPRPPPPPRP
jgi:hypothetical protein